MIEWHHERSAVFAFERASPRWITDTVYELELIVQRAEVRGISTPPCSPRFRCVKHSYCRRNLFNFLFLRMRHVLDMLRNYPS